VWGVFVPQRDTGQTGVVVEGAADLAGGVIIDKSSSSHYVTLGIYWAKLPEQPRYGILSSMDAKRPKQTPQAIASMRQLFPLFVKFLTSPGGEQSLLIQQQVVNWDFINDIERECGLPLTPCPNSVVYRHLGLDEQK